MLNREVLNDGTLDKMGIVEFCAKCSLCRKRVHNVLLPLEFFPMEIRRKWNISDGNSLVAAGFEDCQLVVDSLPT